MRRLLICFVGAVLGASAWAQVVDARTEGAKLIVNEVTICEVKSSLNGLTPDKRAQLAAQTLLTYRSGASVSVVKPETDSSADWSIQLGGRGVVTINQAEAAAQGTSVADLSSQWARRMNDALRLKPITLPAQDVILPPDGRISLPLTGPRARKAEIKFSASGIVTMDRNLGRLDIRPRALGETKMTVSSGPVSQQVVIRVLPYAVKFPQSFVVRVQGRPASADAVKAAAEGALWTMLKAAQPGHTATVTVSDTKALQPGAETVVTVRAMIEAPNCFPSEGTATVRVINWDRPAPVEQIHWYSNNPENVKAAQILFNAHLEQGKPIRFMAHHLNQTSWPMQIRALLANPSAEAATVFVRTGDAEPHANPTYAGYISGKLFLETWQRGEGSIVTIPAGSAVPIILRRVAPGDTMSTLGTLEMIDDDPSGLYFRVESLHRDVREASWPEEGTGQEPWRRCQPLPYTRFHGTWGGPVSKHIYAPAVKNEQYSYEAGGRFLFIRLGDHSIASTTSDDLLLGDFGVQYGLTVTLTNPLAVSQKTEMIFEASAGYSGALFLVNGKLVDGRLLQAKAKLALWQGELAPGQTLTFKVDTIPLGGAHYPATITVRPVGVAD